MTSPNLPGDLSDSRHQYLGPFPLPRSGTFMNLASEHWKCNKKGRTNDVNPSQSLQNTGFSGKRGTKLGITPRLSRSNPTAALFCFPFIAVYLALGMFPIIWNIHWGTSYCSSILRQMNAMEQYECQDCGCLLRFKCVS